MMSSSDPVSGRLLSGAKQAYAATARTVGTALTRVGALPEQPPERDRRLQHWAFSLTRVHDSVAIADLDVPWWTYRAIDVVEAWLLARPGPVRVFEYGSGASTRWLAARAGTVWSVEHHRGFAEHISGTILAGLDNVTLRVVEPVSNDRPRTPSAKEGHAGLDFTAYVHAIDDLDGNLDLVVIDGRAREACLRQALPRLSPTGIIVFDNSRRRRYREAIDAAGVLQRRLPGLTPTLPYPDQTSILWRT